jgi:hypothetical protein
LREYWRELNRYDRAKLARQRKYRKTYTKRRPKCRCDAYKFPHRPGGGLCRYPDPPAVPWREREVAEVAARVAHHVREYGEPRAMTMAELTALLAKSPRPYRKRYAGILRQIARNNGLHPIRDRDLIRDLMPHIVAMAKQLKRRCPKGQYKYRNMEIIDHGDGNHGVRGIWTTAGPTM